MSKVRPQLKRLHSPDISDLDSFRPDDQESFSFLLQAMFGPQSAEGEESYDLVVCTPKWLEQNISADTILPGRHRLIVKEYNIEKIRDFLIRYARRCEGDTWREVAEKLSRIGRSEFEDFTS
jgi:hypothetical protein